MATNSQEVHSLPLRERKAEKKKAKTNFRLNTVDLLAQKCHAKGQKLPLH